jgi:hypothetical protein
MKEQKLFGTEIAEQVSHTAELHLVVPFTTPELTRAALNTANRMGAGLNATLRLIRVQVVPYPMDLDQSPVYLEFLKEQLAQFISELPTTSQICLARDFDKGLMGTLTRDSVVVLATRKRLWKTRTERLAASLRHAGHNVILVEQNKEAENA